MPRITVYQDGYLIADSGAPTYAPPEQPPAPPSTPPSTPLPPGAKRVAWEDAGKQTFVTGPVAVHVAVPADAKGILRAFIELSTSAPTLPTGSLYAGVDRKTADGGGVVRWDVRMGDIAAPGQSQGYTGTDLIVNVEDAELLVFQFQWYPA